MKKQDVLSYFKQKAKPQSFRELSDAFHLNRQEARRFKRLLREMLQAGELVLTRKGLYAPPQEINLVRGYFEAHADYGFVVPDAPGQRDLFIAPYASMGAMDSDRVIARPEAEGGRKGRIIRILERARRRIPGRVEKSRAGCFVKPRGRAFKSDIYIPSQECAKVKNGQNVIVEIVEFPSGEEKRPPAGKIVKILEPPEGPRDELEGIMEQFSLPARFPKNVADAARRMRAGTEEEGEGAKKSRRKDLTRLPTVTIDGERAKDFDDAVSIRLTDIGFRLWVHIADVSHYVPWDGDIDLEARRRGTSVYFPDRVVPMLPKELSENLCSLVPGEDRPAFTVQMDFDRFGKRYGAEFYTSTIRSNERMTYTAVAKILSGDDPGLTARYGALARDFELMSELASQMRARRLGRGSLDFDLPEPEVLLDLQGRPEAIIKSERNIAHIIIEEFMIAANEAVAERLDESGVPAIYRIHEQPDPVKMDEVLRFARVLLGKRSADIQEALAAARGRPEEEIMNFTVLRSLKQARYSTVNAGHFGLASECYTHFTSPIRRYPDLVVHRLLKESIRSGRKTKKAKTSSAGPAEELAELLPEIAFTSSRMERNADDAEREVLKAMKAWFMKERLGEELPVRVIEVTSYGLKVRFEDFYVESFIHVSLMTDDFYVFNEKDLSLTGKKTRRMFRMGDMIKARIERVDLDDREVVLGLD